MSIDARAERVTLAGTTAAAPSVSWANSGVRRLLVYTLRCGPMVVRRDGVPFYMSGPYDNPRAVVRTLDRTCGEGNYHYVVGTG